MAASFSLWVLQACVGLTKLSLAHCVLHSSIVIIESLVSSAFDACLMRVEVTQAIVDS